MPLGGTTASFEQWLGLGQSFAFGLQIDGDVFVGRVDADVSHPIGDRAEVDSGTE